MINALSLFVIFAVRTIINFTRKSKFRLVKMMLLRDYISY